MAKLSGSGRINNALEKYDIKTFNDVIFHLPRSYLNLNYSKEFEMNSNDKVTLFLEVSTNPSLFKSPKVSIIRFQALSSSNTSYTLVAYNQRYIMSLLKLGMKFTVYGIINLAKREISIIKIFPRKLRPEEQIMPLYSLPSDIANHEFVSIVNKAFLNVNLVSKVPVQLVSKNGLIPLKSALKLVHKPQTITDVFNGLNTLKYEEGFSYFLKLLLIKRTNSQLFNERKTIVNLKDANTFVQNLPFSLTKDQLNAVREIGYDMNRQQLMYRLLQGDVGSGKTVVAFTSLYINYLRNAQGALLAPTESLAKQHYASLIAFFKPFPHIKISLLIGALTDSDKKEVKEGLLRGEIDIIVGTHALFSEDVKYKSLELVIIDEQHKFGVNQRTKLLNKGEKADLLLLSATPIPQTLANVIYGDSDITTIKTFPHQGRQVETLINNFSAKDIKAHINKTIEQNRQVYIIAPKISWGGKASVLKLYEQFAKWYPGKVTLLHGQQSSEEKDRALSNFTNGDCPILVSTTVVEVGIDVKNAGLMIIFEPNSFGLSSLHQLRGRIGRDGEKATLCLVSEDEDNTKLISFAGEIDGFKIAELDLSLRGPGELTGDKQSGMPSFLYLNVIKDINLITKVKEDVNYVLQNPDEPEHAYLISETLKDIIYM